jgi:hypothetical protein
VFPRSRSSSPSLLPVEYRRYDGTCHASYTHATDCEARSDPKRWQPPKERGDIPEDTCEHSQRRPVSVAT